MREENFGLGLLIKTDRKLGEALAYINARPRPLALSFYGGKRETDRVLSSTISGGASINHVNDRVPASELCAAAQKLADKLAAKSPTVLHAMKRVADRALDQTAAAALRDEMLALRDHLRSADLRERLAAFATKRKPAFTGR
jgi:hypothetical protein